MRARLYRIAFVVSFLSLCGQAALYRAQYSEDAKGKRVLESFGKIQGDEERVTRAVEETSYPRFRREKAAALTLKSGSVFWALIARN